MSNNNNYQYRQRGTNNWRGRGGNGGGGGGDRGRGGGSRGRGGGNRSYDRYGDQNGRHTSNFYEQNNHRRPNNNNSYRGGGNNEYNNTYHQNNRPPNTGHRGGHRGGGRSRGHRGGHRGRGGHHRGGHYRGGHHGRGGRGHRGGYRGHRGRGHRGRGRGGGRGYNQSNKTMVRFHDPADEQLGREVLVMNKDHPGPQQIRVLKFAKSQWEAVESLTRGDFYYHNRLEKKNNRRKPQELADSTAIKTEYRPYRVEYAPRPTEYASSAVRIILKTNSFQVRGKILETSVHQFEVHFSPSIKSEEVALREKIVLGNNSSTRRKNYELLRKTFGEFQFDNHALYSMGDIGSDSSSQSCHEFANNLHSDYVITFSSTGDLRLSDPSIPIQQQEALLNIFNRKRLQNCGFSRIGRGWFKKGNNKEISVISNNCSCPDVNIIHGFECSMRILPKRGDRQLTVFKADLSHKLVERLTLHDKILLLEKQFLNKCGSVELFRAKVERECRRRHFLLAYNRRNLQVSEIDWKQNETSSFTLSSGGKISYRDYLWRQYCVKSPRNESCVIVDRTGAVFLPQHIRLTITSKQSDAIYDEVLNFVNPRTDERLSRIENFVQHINSNNSPPFANGKGGKGGNGGKKGVCDNLDISFEIEEDSLNTPAMVLQMPNIVIMGEHGPLQGQPVDDFKYFETRGFLKDTRSLSQWGIVYSESDIQSFDSFYRAWTQYTKKRHFDIYSGPITRPSARPISEMTVASVTSSKYLLSSHIVREGDEMLVLILPDGILGSEIKAKFTKTVQNCSFAIPTLVQCINASTCRKMNACLGTFEDMMIKFGNIPYMIEPLLPSGNDFIDVTSCWCWGLDVSHVQNKPSVVCLSISRAPFEGSLRNMHFLAHLNPSRKEIVAFANMVTLAYRALEEAYNACLSHKQRLPQTIFVFRDGVADGQIQELFTKEVVGIQRALTIFREKYKLKKWKPQIEYILCNKNTIDRFGLLDQKTGLVKSLNKPCVVYDHVLSDRLWDFIIFPYHYKKNADRTKGVRYVVLFDGMKLHKKCGAARDLFQFIFALTYMFAFSIPFPLGGTAQPAPIVYAKHYAESFSQQILHNDKSISDLKINNHQKLINRPHVITKTIFQ